MILLRLLVWCVLAIGLLAGAMLLTLWAIGYHLYTRWLERRAGAPRHMKDG